MNYYKTCVYGTKRVFERRNKILQECYLKKNHHMNGYIRIICGFFHPACIYNILVVKDTNAAL